MKFFVFAAAILALSTASTLFRGDKTISVNDDGTILITDETAGKQVIIRRPIGLNRNIELSVVGPTIPWQTIQIDDDILTANVGLGIRGLSQSQILTDILKENQGLLDESTYGLLLQRLDQAVNNGQISRTIFNVLEDLDIPIDVLLSLGQQIPLSGQQGVVGQRMLPINQIPITSSGLVENLPIDILRRNILGTQQGLDVSSLINPLLSVNNMMMKRTPMVNQWMNDQRLVGLGMNRLVNQVVLDNQIGQQIPIIGNGIVPQTWLNRQQMVVPGVGKLVSGVRGNDIEQLIGSGINQVPQSWLVGQQTQVPWSGVQVMPQELLPVMQKWMSNQLPLVQQQQLPILRNILGNINQLPVLQQQQQQPIVRNILGNINQLPVLQQLQSTPIVRSTLLNNILMGRPVQTLGSGLTQGLGVNRQRGFLQDGPVNMMGVPQMVLN